MTIENGGYTSVNFADDVQHGADAVVLKALFEEKLIQTIRGLRDNPVKSAKRT